MYQDAAVALLAGACLPYIWSFRTRFNCGQLCSNYTFSVNGGRKRDLEEMQRVGQSAYCPVMSQACCTACVLSAGSVWVGTSMLTVMKLAKWLQNCMYGEFKYSHSVVR